MSKHFKYLTVQDHNDTTQPHLNLKIQPNAQPEYILRNQSSKDEMSADKDEKDLLNDLDLVVKFL